MQLIIDANILVAAFLKSATTRELIFDEEIELFAPEYFILEVNRTLKKDKFFRIHTTLTKEEIEELLSFLFKPIKIIPEEEYFPLLKKAAQYVPFDDAPYLALSLAIRIPIWSNDTALKKQSLIKVYTTAELVRIINA